MNARYRQGFETLHAECDDVSIAVRGRLPTWLSGTLLRNGPAGFEAGARPVRHWFDGLAMLHKFAIGDGKVVYANKYVESPQFSAVRDTGRLAYREFATDPCRSIFKRVTSVFAPELGHNANINVGTIADRFVAWTETPIPIEFDAETLATRGVFRFDDEIEIQTSTPHPHATRAGDLLNNSVKFGATNAYHIYRIRAGQRKRKIVATLPVREPAYMHSFGITESHVILAEYPLRVAPLKLLLSGRSFAENLRWHSDQPTRFLVVRLADGALVQTIEAAPFFAFHHVNAWEQDGTLVVDLLAYPDAAVIEGLYLAALRQPTPALHPQPPAELRRYTLRPQATDAAYEVLASEPMELPRIDYQRCNGRPYRYVYGVGLDGDPADDFTNQLVKTDVVARRSQVWRDADCYPGEPVFVAAPGAMGEDDGVVLSVVLDARAGRSFLLVLDAKGFEELARAEAPHHLPFGFHGAFVPTGNPLH